MLRVRSRVQGVCVLKSGDIAVNIGDRFCEEEGYSVTINGRMLELSDLALRLGGMVLNIQCVKINDELANVEPQLNGQDRNTEWRIKTLIEGRIAVAWHGTALVCQGICMRHNHDKAAYAKAVMLCVHFQHSRQYQAISSAISDYSDMRRQQN